VFADDGFSWLTQEERDVVGDRRELMRERMFRQV
jgi:hypothetical protein